MCYDLSKKREAPQGHSLTSGAVMADICNRRAGEAPSLDRTPYVLDASKLATHENGCSAVTYLY
jgi:hypothetical protein